MQVGSKKLISCCFQYRSWKCDHHVTTGPQKVSENCDHSMHTCVLKYIQVHLAWLFRIGLIGISGPDNLKIQCHKNIISIICLLEYTTSDVLIPHKLVDRLYRSLKYFLCSAIKISYNYCIETCHSLKKRVKL